MSSNDKGKWFERKVVDIIRKEFNLDKKECYRTPISGGHPYTIKSDITFGKEDLFKKINLFIECKYRSKVKDWQNNDFIKILFVWGNDISKISKWKPVKWLEEVRKKNDTNSLSIVVFGRPNSEILTICKINDIKKYGEFKVPLVLGELYYIFLFKDFLTQWRYKIHWKERV